MTQKGYTTSELILAGALVAILAVLAFMSYNISRQHQRDEQRLLDMDQIRTALEFYYNEKGSYPKFEQDFINIGGQYQVLCNTDQGWQVDKQGCGQVYLKDAPSNPEPGGQAYQYKSLLNGQEYVVKFILEGDRKDYQAGPRLLTAEGIK